MEPADLTKNVPSLRKYTGSVCHTYFDTRKGYTEIFQHRITRVQEKQKILNTFTMLKKLDMSA